MADVEVIDASSETSRAEEHAIDAKLTAAALKKRRRVEEGTTAGLVPLRDRIAALMPDVTPRDHIVTRIPIEEGERPTAAALTRASVKQLVPSRFAEASFENFSPTTASQRTALDGVQYWARGARHHQGIMLALIGLQGTGKSHLLYAAARTLLLANVPIYARAWYRLADELRYGGVSPFAPEKMLEPHEVRAMLWRHQTVLIDEVRATASTAFDDTELAKFACWAYDSGVSVLITTNVSPLAEVMGAPAASRFTQITIDGPDWRQR